MVGEHRKTQAGGAKGSVLVSVRESMQTGRFSPVMTIAERESKVICCWLKARVWSCVMKWRSRPYLFRLSIPDSTATSVWFYYWRSASIIQVGETEATAHQRATRWKCSDGAFWLEGRAREKEIPATIWLAVATTLGWKLDTEVLLRRWNSDERKSLP